MRVHVRLLDQELARWHRFFSLPHPFRLLLRQAHAKLHLFQRPIRRRICKRRLPWDSSDERSAASGSQRSASVRRCTVLVRQTPAALPRIISAHTDRTSRKMPSSHMLLSFASWPSLGCLRKSTFSPNSMPLSLASLLLERS